jgi:CRP-like cAMP-binding protein
MESIERALAQHPFLADLDRRYLQRLARFASKKSFKALQMIFHEGEEANECYLICTGRVALEMPILGCNAIRIQDVGEGEVLGWSWLLPPYQWHFSARAVEPVEVIALDGRALRTRFEEDHDLGYELLKRFAQVVVQRLVATRGRFLNFTGPRPPSEVPAPVPFPLLEE